MIGRNVQRQLMRSPGKNPHLLVRVPHSDTPLTLNERREGGIDLGLVASVQENQVQPKRVCRHLQVGSLVTGSRLVGSLSTPIVAALGVNPVQQLQPLCCERRGRIRYAGDVCTWRFRLATSPALTRSIPNSKTMKLIVRTRSSPATTVQGPVEQTRSLRSSVTGGWRIEICIVSSHERVYT
jgi:hypothetical protein